jgi:hypothetical protein
MAPLIFPVNPLPSYSYGRSQAFKTLMSVFDSGAEQRRALIQFSMRNYQLVYNNKVLADRNTMHNFYRQCQGSFNPFWFVDFSSGHWITEYLGRGFQWPMVGAVAAVHPDSSDTNRTDETAVCNTMTANGMHLMQASPAVNDSYYFGYQPTDPLINQYWDVLYINVGTAGAGTYTLTWEYWTGSAWSSLSNVTDNTNSFKTAGWNYVKWDWPATWGTTAIKGYTTYWVRARVSAFTSLTTEPLGSGAYASTRYYDLHCYTPSANLVVYDNGVVQTGGGTNYSVISGGGQASADLIKFVNAPNVGDLLTSDFDGQLRIKGRLDKDDFTEDVPYRKLFNFKLGVQEIQW